MVGTTTAPADTPKCTLAATTFDDLIQVVLGVIALCVLILKRQREKPRRPFKVWALDASKQVMGAGFAHLLNIGLAIWFSSAAGSGDECAFYFINFFIDTSIGVGLNYLLIRTQMRTAQYLVARASERDRRARGAGGGGGGHSDVGGGFGAGHLSDLQLKLAAGRTATDVGAFNSDISGDGNGDAGDGSGGGGCAVAPADSGVAADVSREEEQHAPQQVCARPSTLCCCVHLQDTGEYEVDGGHRTSSAQASHLGLPEPDILLTPLVVRRWLIQLGAWIAIIMVVKMLLGACIYAARSPLDALGSAIFSPLRSKPKVELVIVMIMCPCFMNMLQFWVQDSFLKRRDGERTGDAQHRRLLDSRPGSSEGSDTSGGGGSGGGGGGPTVPAMARGAPGAVATRDEHGSAGSAGSIQWDNEDATLEATA